MKNIKCKIQANKMTINCSSKETRCLQGKTENPELAKDRQK